MAHNISARGQGQGLLAAGRRRGHPRPAPARAAHLRRPRHRRADQAHHRRGRRRRHHGGQEGTGVDLLLGIGGTPEGIIAATARSSAWAGSSRAGSPPRRRRARPGRRRWPRPEQVLTTDDLVASEDDSSSPPPASPTANCWPGCCIPSRTGRHPVAGHAGPLGHHPDHHQRAPALEAARLQRVSARRSPGQRMRLVKARPDIRPACPERIGYGPVACAVTSCGDPARPVVPTLTAVIRGCGPDPRVAGGWPPAWHRLLLGGRAAARVGWPSGSAYSAALSMASVPVIAVLLARATGGGVTLWVALAAVGDRLRRRSAGLPAEGRGAGQRRPGAAVTGRGRDPRVLLLIAGVRSSWRSPRCFIWPRQGGCCW